MRIQVVGMECEPCRRTYTEACAVVARLGIAAEIERIDDPAALVRLRLLTIPAVLIDGQLVLSGYRGQKAIEQAIRRCMTTPANMT